MEVTMHYKNLEVDEKLAFEKYVEEKLEKIENLLTKFADDAVLLKLSIEKFEKHDAFGVEMHLSLPSKSIVAKEASHSITKAVDLSKGRLVEQLKKHMSKLRHESDISSIRG